MPSRPETGTSGVLSSPAAGPRASSCSPRLRRRRWTRPWGYWMPPVPAGATQKSTSWAYWTRWAPSARATRPTRSRMTFAHCHQHPAYETPLRRHPPCPPAGIVAPGPEMIGVWGMATGPRARHRGREPRLLRHPGSRPRHGAPVPRPRHR